MIDKYLVLPFWSTHGSIQNSLNEAERIRTGRHPDAWRLI